MTKGHLTRRTDILICVLLAVLVLAALGRTLQNGFVNYDDDRYIYENVHVKGGPTLRNVAWAFTATYASNWHPVTWISHMLDCRLFGLNPLGHHLSSLLIHLANTLILFGLLKRMTGSRWRSAFVAGLFGVHPLHVESVAWVAERKDLLSALFWLLATWAYARYAERPSLRGYSLIVMAFALGLMSKPMIVTLPFIFLLLDYWPLDRIKSVGRWPLVREKLPLFVMSGISCIITYVAQNKGMAVGSLERLPMGERAANAVTACVAYMGKMVFPYRLAAFYPHPKDTLPMLYVLGASVLLACITIAVLRLRNRPYLLIGWLWYLVALIPVIGLVQVGWQAMADRYTYIPMIGLFVMISWGVTESMGVWGCGSMGEGKSPGRPLAHSLTVLAAAVVIAGLGYASNRQAAYWKDGITLFTHALRVTRNNPVAESNLAVALSDLGKTDEAIVHHRRALEIEPEWADAHYNLGSTFLKTGRLDKAIPEFREALRINPQYAQAHNNLGAALLSTGRVPEAVARFTEAVRLKPDYFRAYMNLGTALSDQGRWDEAIAALRKAVSLDPTMPDAHHNLAITLAQTGQVEEAITEFREALRLKPDWPDAQNNLAYMLATQPYPSAGECNEAVTLAESACLATHYKSPTFLDTLTRAYASAGRFADAARTARQAAAFAEAAGQTDAARRLSATARLYESLKPGSEQSP